jgi:hypothetical protein
VVARHARIGSALIVLLITSATLLALRGNDDTEAQPGGWPAVIAIVIGSAVVHEVLHAIGWKVFGGVPWREMSVRSTWAVMGFAAHTETPMPLIARRASTLLPALVLGVGPIVAGLITRSGLLAMWGAFFVLECFSDFTELLASHSPTPRIARGRE